MAVRETRTIALAFFICLIAPAVLADVLSDAKDAIRRGQYETAANQLLIAAESGQSEAQRLLAGLFRTGKGVEKDTALSVYWMERSANQGDIRAAYELGRMLGNEQSSLTDREKAMHWLAVAAESGHSGSKRALVHLQSAAKPQQPDSSYRRFKQFARHRDDRGMRDLLANTNLAKDQDFLDQALITASGGGRFWLASILLDNGADAHATNAVGDTALLAAIRSGQADLTRHLLESGSDIEFRDAGGHTPFLVAAKSGVDDICFMLEAAGANIAARNHAGKTALDLADWGDGGDGLLADRLQAMGIDRMAKIESPARAGSATLEAYIDKQPGRQLPIIEAARSGDVDQITRLVEHGDVVNQVDRNGLTALDWACIHGQDSVISILIKHGADPVLKSEVTGTPISRCMATGETATLKVMLDSQARWPGDTLAGLLVEALASTRLGQAWELLEAGAPCLDDVGVGGMNTLEFSMRHANPRASQILLGRCKDVDHTAEHGRTSLWFAANYGDHPVAKRLLIAGANANVRDADGDTAIMAAARQGDRRMVGILLAHGANISQKSNSGEDALWQGAYRGHAQVVSTLLQQGADAHSRNARGESVLHAVVMSGSVKLCQILMAAGAKAARPARSGQTPLTLAQQSNNPKMVACLENS